MFNRNKPATNVLPGSDSNTINNAIMVELANDYMRDKKIKRRWKTAFTIGILLYLFSTLYLVFSGNKSKVYNKSHTALVELSGPIGTQAGVSSDQINASLRKAFDSALSKGVIMRINSPGGTPVQSAEINEEIRRLKALHPDKPFHVVISDMCASGGYFVAAAADQIYANRSSLVGSIGVRMDGFGFVDAMKKYGVERRSLTAGKNKAILDPFLPVKPEQKIHAETMLNQVHQHFIDVVKEGRGDKLADNPDLFTGLFWSGEEAKRLGLVDEFGNIDSVARDVIGAEKVIDYTVTPNFLEQFSRQFGVAIGTGIANVLGGQYQLN